MKQKLRVILIISSLIIGCFMLVDGIHVLLKGKYIGPEKPGPWADIIGSLGVNVFKLGAVFISYGLVWIFFAATLITKQPFSRIFGIILGVLTLWYVPVGSSFAMIVITLWFLKVQYT